MSFPLRFDSVTQLCIFVAFASSIGWAQTPPRYTAVFLGAAVNTTGMNQVGACVGTTPIGTAQRAWIATARQPLTPLPLPAGMSSSSAEDINDLGVVVGAVSPTTSTQFQPQAAAWTPNAMGGYDVRLLGILPGDDRSYAFAVNNVGDILGTSARNLFGRTVLFAASGPVELVGLSNIDPRSINDDRVFIGGSPSCKRVDLDTMVIEDLGVPPGFASAQGYEINANGQVAGFAGLPTSLSCALEAARYTDGVGWEIFSGCGVSNACYDLNVRGDVVMKLNVAPYVRFQGLGTFRIEDLIDAPVGHWFVTNGYGIAINDARQMVVPASNLTTGEGGLILLTPRTTCQVNLGFAGPGALRLTLCGGNLSSGTQADLELASASLGSPAVLVIGTVANPTPFAGGSIVPTPWLVTFPLVVKPWGSSLIYNIPGGGGPVSVYLQAVQLDPALPFGLAFSNALRADFLP